MNTTRPHCGVSKIASKYMPSGLHAEAVFEVMKDLVNHVKHITGSKEDGTSLMNHAFSEKKPLLEIADLTTTGQNIQAGYRFLFAGAVQAWRNPGAHAAHGTLVRKSPWNGYHLPAC